MMPVVRPMQKETTGKQPPKQQNQPRKQPVVFENKPTIAITKAKARATAKATAKAITKENLSSCQADKPPREKRFLFLGQDVSSQETGICTGGSAIPWVHPLSCAPGVYAHLGTS